MAYYLIAAGGTGAKCVNAFVNLCAAGLMPDQDPVQLYFVDADQHNGNRGTTIEGIERYQKAFTGFKELGADLGHDCPLFKTPIMYKKGDPQHNWNPIQNPGFKLSNILDINSLQSKGHKDLYRALFAKHKREDVSFQNGFLGWPSVGSAIISSAFSDMEHLTDAIAKDPNAKVLLMGSIFGGTGAASIPTLAKLLQKSFRSQNNPNNREHRSLGMVLMLPYFMFDNGDVESNKYHENPNIDPLNFALKTKYALKYYYNHKMHEICDKIYLLGDSHLNKVSYEKQIGGQTQKNKPHYMELYAAFAAINFFGQKHNDDSDSNQVYMETCRRSVDSVNWGDLPYEEGRNDVIYEKMHKATSSAYAFNAMFMPIFRSLLKNTSGVAQQHPWFLHLLKEKNVDLKEARSTLDAVHSYNYSYLNWLNELHTPLNNDPQPVNINLFNRTSLQRYLDKDKDKDKDDNVKATSPFEELSDPDYITLTHHMDPSRKPAKGGFFRATGFKKLRQEMNHYKVEAATGAPTQLGVFFNALYNCSL